MVLISSAAATLGGAGEYVWYAASKGAIDTMTIGLARELAAEGIRVNAVAPGLIETDIHPPGRLERISRRCRSGAPAPRRRSPRRSCSCCRTPRPTRPARSCASPVGADPRERLASARAAPMIPRADGEGPSQSSIDVQAKPEEMVMVAAVRVHKHGGPEVLTYEEFDLPPPGPGPGPRQAARERRQLHRHLFPQRALSVADRHAVRLRQRGRRRGDRGRAGRHRPQGRRPRRLRGGARRLCGRAQHAGRSRREAAGLDHLRAGRRHDAQGHDGAISAQPHLQGRARA